MLRILAALMAALIATPALAQPGSPFDLTKLGAPDYTITNPKGLDRAYYFTGDNHSLSSVTGEIERYIDPTYCAAADPVQADPVQGFTITARVATPAERVACHLKPSEAFVSGLVTTQHQFSSTYGYWVMVAQLPSAMRTWPAFWLLPTLQTAANAGARPEIDVLEEYAGVLHGVTGTTKWTLDRTGQPISTVHPQPAGTALTCGALPTFQENLSTAHVYGLLWQPTKITFYADYLEMCSINVSVGDPHYLLINLGMSGDNLSAGSSWTPGPTSPATYPATMKIISVQHWTLAKGAQ